MKYIIAGAGKMARAVAYFLLKQKDTEKIFIFDSNQDALNYFKKTNKIKTIKKEFSKLKSLKTISKEADAVISCLPYFCNLKLTELAIKAGFNFIDLGGNNNIVKAQHKLDKKAKSKKISIVPDCGLAPGLVSLLAAYYVNYFEKVKSIKIYVGGLPVSPKPPLNYALVFSVSGLINEYIEDVIVLRNNNVKTVESLTGLEKVKIEKENYEAFFTSGGISTMPKNFKNKVKNLEYKTLRYPGHCEKIKFMNDIGFFKEPYRVLTEEFLHKILFEKNVKDKIVLKVIAEGIKNKVNKKKSIKLIDYYDRKTGLTAMMRMTGFPAAATAVLIARKIIKNKGVLFNELDIPVMEIFKMLNAFNIKFQGIKIA